MSKPIELPYRQIHLDFHTSSYIPGVGNAFDADQFVETLKLGHVNAINVFAKCHHGMCYYPTAIGTVHPSLEIDLFGRMVQACRKNGIRVVAYVPVGWEEDAAERHPEWMQVGNDGVLGGKKPFDSGYYRWRFLCHNNPAYVEYVIAQTKELISQYHIDGFWYDIVVQTGCLCASCRKSLRQEGLDPSSDEDVRKHDQLALERFMERIRQTVDSCKPGLSVYFNRDYQGDSAATGTYSVKKLVKSNTHIEIESLPGGQWGYNHFPLVVNYHNAYDYELVGMTGKFHKSWGDFGTLKNKAALAFECFRMIANGAKCSIGDQLHPSGKMDPAVYRLIGEIYRSVEEKEPWCVQSRKAAGIGVLTTIRELDGGWWPDGKPEPLADEGVMRMLMELHQSFDFVDVDADLTKYGLVILPDAVTVDVKLRGKLQCYIAGGGKLILSHESGLLPDRSGFALETFGVRYAGKAPYAPDYIRFAEHVPFRITLEDSCCYGQGSRIEALPGSEILAFETNPYFNRTFDRFSSHCQTPPDRMTNHPAIVHSGNVIYISKPLFSDYIQSGNRAYRDILRGCMELLQVKPLIRSDLPTTAEVTVRKQEARTVIHILHYIPQRKAKELDIIEEAIPLYNRSVSVKLEAGPLKVRLVPEGREIPFYFQAAGPEEGAGYASFTVPVIDGHRMIVIE